MHRPVKIMDSSNDLTLTIATVHSSNNIELDQSDSVVLEIGKMVEK